MDIAKASDLAAGNVSDPAGNAAPAAPLAGVRVLDLTRVRSGPTCVRQLADWGAEVVKVETPPGQDAGDLGGAREGSDFQNLHRNKRSITLNLKSPDGVEALKRLAARADIVVENFRPDVKDRLGIGYAALSAENPRLIYVSISGFGQDGPYAQRPGFDQIAQGMGGLMSITGLPGQGPVRVGIPIADLCAGIFASQGAMLALIERERSGRGQWVQTSLLQAQAFMLDFQASRWLMEGQVAKQAGNDHPTSIPTGVFPTADGHINLATAGQAIWRRAAEALGAPEWITDPRFELAKSRSANRAELNALIAERTRTRTSEEWVSALNAAGVPSGPINTIDKVFADPQAKHLGLSRELDADGRTVPYVAQPIVLSRTPSVLRSHPPEQGQHTDEVLREAGYDDDSIARLHESGAV